MCMTKPSIMPISLYQPLNSNNSNIKKKENFLIIIIIIIIIMIIIYYLYCANSTDVYMIKCASAVKVPRVININFLPTIFVQNQAEGLLELTK